MLFPTQHWNLSRAVFLVAGFFSLASVILGYFIHPYFWFFTGFVGLMQMIFALTGFCPMAIILHKLFKLECNWK